MPTTEAPAATGLAIEAVAVTFAYGTRPALDGLTLRVPQGSLFGLLGPNGSGKSTLISLLAGLRLPDSGSLTVLGQTPSPGLRKRMGILFQAPSLDPLMTVRETLWLHGRLHGLHGPKLRQRIRAVLEDAGLYDRLDAPVRTLSGGMKRRLELARALLPEPELLLFDEPTTGLDPESELALWERLAQANRNGVTVVMSTNEVGEADGYCDTVAFMYRGRLVAQGTPAELKEGLRRDAVWAEGQFTEELVREIRSWPGVGRATWSPPILHADVDSASSFVPRLFQAAGDKISAVRLREATLEDAYFDIVGAALSDADGPAGPQTAPPEGPA